MLTDFTIFNTELDFEITIKVDTELITLLFLPKDAQKKSKHYLELQPHVLEVISEDSQLFEPFVILADFLKKDPKDLLNLFLIMISREDQRARHFLCEVPYSKEDLVQKFKNFQRKYFVAPDTKNVIAPDILLHLLCYIWIHEHNQNSLEIPQELVPYILNISGVQPDLPNDFDPNLPYENDEVVFKKDNFLTRLLKIR